MYITNFNRCIVHESDRLNFVPELCKKGVQPQERWEWVSNRPARYLQTHQTSRLTCKATPMGRIEGRTAIQECMAMTDSDTCFAIRLKGNPSENHQDLEQQVEKNPA